MGSCRSAPIGYLSAVLTGGLVLLLSASCSSATPRATGTDGGTGGFGGGDPGSGVGNEACVADEAEAVPGARPVDIVFAIDNSDSMAEEIAEVEAQINVNFASIIESSKIDYRVIMLSSHGSHGGNDPVQRICVSAPLSGTDCSPIPKKPAETSRFFHHNVIINSQDTLCQILGTYRATDKDGSHPGGWASLLRPNAFKVFAVITDDRVAAGPCGGWPKFDDKNDDTVSAKNSAATFETALFALDPAMFGTSGRRNYVWHSIVGLAPFDSGDPKKPYPPSAPLSKDKCTPGSVASGLGYQALSQLTGGLRYPTCGLDYTTIFTEMAKGVIDQAVLPCSYAIPANPSGGTIDPATAVVRYTSGEKVTDFGQVETAAACAPGKFTIEDGRIKLCPEACRTIQSDPEAQVKILYGCLPNAK